MPFCGARILAILPALILISSTAHADGGRCWNTVGDLSCPADRNYLEKDIGNSLSLLYKSIGINPPSSDPAPAKPADGKCTTCQTDSTAKEPLSPEEITLLEDVKDQLAQPYDEKARRDFACVYDIAKNAFEDKRHNYCTLNTRSVGRREKTKVQGKWVWKTRKQTVTSFEPVVRKKPCVSPAAVELVTMGLKQAAHCTAVSPELCKRNEPDYCTTITAEETFPMLAHESGFNLIVTSDTGASGLGQLTGTAITDTDFRFGDTVTGAALADSWANLSGDKACAAFADLKRPETVREMGSGKCNLLKFPEGPFNNLFLSLQHYKKMKLTMLDTLRRDAPNQYQLLKQNPKLMEQVIRDGAYPSYNGGAWIQAKLVARLKAELRAPVTEERVNLILDRFFADVKKGVRSIRPHLLKGATPPRYKEVGAYPGHVHEMRDHYQKGDRSCFAD